MIIQFPRHKLTHRFTDSLQDSWLCCVPYYAQLMRIEYQLRKLRKGPEQ